MERSKKELLEKTYREFMEVGLESNEPNLLEGLVDKNIMGFGTAIDEKILGIEEFKKLLNNQKIQSKGLDITWRNEPVHRFISQDENSAVFAENVYATIKTGEEAVEMYMRFSTVLNYSGKQWKVVHWHGSKPEEVASEKDTWGIDIWKQKTEELEKLVKEKTADLLEKNRELEIEAALERIRARTMAMQSSDELAATASLLFQELQGLGISTYSSGFTIWDEEQKHLISWMCNADGSMNPPFRMPIEENDWHKSQFESWKKGESFLKKDFSGKEMEDYFKYLHSFQMLKKAFQKSMDAGFPLPERQIHHVANFASGNLLFITLEPLSGDQALFQRFVKVFEQTYTRFLDLEKAEFQAREATIEAALEKVRSRSLAMHKSDELNEVVAVLFEKLKDLEIPFTAVGIATGIEDSKDLNAFVCGQNEAGLVITNYRLPYFENPVPKDLYHALEKQLDFFEGHYSKEEKDAFYHHLIEHTEEFKHLPEDILQMIFNSEAYCISMIAVKNAVFNINDFEGKSLAQHEIDTIKRFARVFEQAYTRFLDLQKAEAQAREAQVEAALERVRSRSMAMHRSAELRAVVDSLYGELKSLQINFDNAVIQLIKDDTKDLHLWISTADGLYNDMIHWPASDLPHFDLMYEARVAQSDFEISLSPDQMNAFFGEYFGLPYVPQERKAAVANVRFFWIFGNYQKNTCVFLMKYSSGAFTSNEKDIITRFSKVFEQTYTRFLDLQKVEAQARESQIQLALERVRARSMAMKSTDELHEVLSVLFRQFDQLGIHPMNVFLSLFDRENRTLTYRASGKSKHRQPQKQVVYVDSMEELKGIYEKFINDKSDSVEVIFYSKEVLPQVFEIFSETFDAMPEDERMKLEYFPDGGYSMAGYTPFGYLGYDHQRPATEEEKEILSRFCLEFTRVYQRFLDIQKAEAQAREARIEAALEKIRSRTMGMQSSAELPEVANLLFLEVQALGIPAWSCGYNILAEDKKTATCCMSSEGTLQTPFQLRLYGEASFDEMGEFIRSDDTMLVQELGGKALEEHYTYMKSFPDLKPTFDEIEKLGLSLPTYQINHLCKFNQGFILFITYEKVPDSQDIFKRFTKVFDQTYTRFLDLIKAEEQARNAQIEASMERVRARAMSMQKPDELVDVATLLRKEMGLLGVEELETSSIYIHHADEGNTECWYAIQDDKKLISDYMTIRLEDTWVGREMLSFYNSDSSKTSIKMQGQHRTEWISYCAEKSHHFSIQEFYGDQIPERTYHLYKFSQGFMGAASPGEISDESWKLLKRAASVFSLAYTRFSDLKQAEAQAREAQIEAALERVRSKTMGMQRSEELSETASVLFEQLQNLGVTHERINIGIINEKNQTIDFWITAQGGNKLDSRYSGRITEETTLSKAYQAWKKGKKSLVIDLQGEELDQWLQFMKEEIKIPFNKKYQHNRRVQTVGFFSKGMLVVTSPEPLHEEALYLLEKFAGVFDLTYTRFTDLKIAEANAVQAEKDLEAIKLAKSKAESALKELKAAQEQLIQQEKLASLGQLTAGIAHEIKNPLNFVNNFSELSKELIEEVFDELAKLESSDIKEDIIDILTDVKSNLTKVHEHGSRADGIVKSMLQHSRGGAGKATSIRINELVKEFSNLAFHGMRAGKNPINVNLNFDLDENAGEVTLVMEDFSRVILNIANNAFDAMRDKLNSSNNGEYLPSLDIKTKRQKNQVLISIQDNGPGIPDDIKDKILQPFFTTKKGTEGTGLGLSITHDIVKAHGGRLDIQSQPGQTIFNIHLKL